MLKGKTDFYIKKADKDKFFGIAKTDGFFCVIETDKGFKKEQGDEFIAQLQEEVAHITFSNMARFESWLNDIILQANLPSDFSLSTGAIFDDILYLKTINKGVIFLKRKERFVKLLEGDKAASGHIKKADFIIFTTTNFLKNFPKKDELKKLVERKTIDTMVPGIESYETDIDEKDCAALFVAFEEKKEEVITESDPVVEGLQEKEEDKKEQKSTEVAELSPPALNDSVHSPIKVDDPSHIEPPSYVPKPSSHLFTDTLLDEKKEEENAKAEKDKLDKLKDDQDKFEKKEDGSISLPKIDKEEEMNDTVDQKDSPEDSLKPARKKLKINFDFKKQKRFLFAQFSKNNLFKSKKVLTIFAVIIFIFLGFSIFFSNQKLQQQKIADKIKGSSETIAEKLTQAEEISFLNPERSVMLLNDARNELNALQSGLNDKEKQLVKNDLDELKQKIDSFEEEILQKEEAQYAEFYDLALEDEAAKGVSMYLFEGTVSVVDPDNQSIYAISLDEKSIDKYKSSKIKSGTVSGMDENGVIFYSPGAGVYRFTNEEGDTEEIIEKDDDWGKITDLSMYFGNIYLLDVEKDDVYKYIVVANGYSGGGSYFLQTHSFDFIPESSIAIDASIYVSLKDKIIKFTRGEADEFNTTFPYDSININGIYTDEEAGKVYALDKSMGSIFVLDKNGRYEREIYAEMLKKAADVTVYNNNIYILSGGKIFIIEEG